MTEEEFKSFADKASKFVQEKKHERASIIILNNEKETTIAYTGTGPRLAFALSEAFRNHKDLQVACRVALIANEMISMLESEDEEVKTEGQEETKSE